MLTKNYQLNIEKSDGTTENISIEIPLKAGTYDVKYTLGTGNAISAGTIVVNSTENTYNLNITLSNNEVKTVQIKTPVILTFADATWEQIAQFSEAGKASEYFAVGDEKTIQLSTGEEITLVILGFNHDDLTSGGKAGMTIGMKNLLSTTYPIRDENTNVGGWRLSTMRISTLPTIFEQLPLNLRSAIKSVDKKGLYGGSSSNQKDVVITSDKLFLLSAVEVDNTASEKLNYTAEGEQYEYWKTVKDGTVATDRIKYLSNGSGLANDWWTRTPYIGEVWSYIAYNVSPGDESFARLDKGVCFAFCV